MRRTFRGPLGWALAAGLVIAACGGTATPPAASGAVATTSSGPRVGSFNRPVVLAFTPSQEASTIATNGAAIKAARLQAAAPASSTRRRRKSSVSISPTIPATA